MDFTKFLGGLLKAAPSLLYMGATYASMREQSKAAKRASQAQQRMLEREGLALEQQRASLTKLQEEAATARKAREEQTKQEEKKTQETKQEVKQETLEKDVERIKRRRGRKSLVTGQKGGLGFFDQYFNA
tara:strand:- start:904 stop:1293 length:390 start_codon:yes stop_codon:yes gene_type:complete